MGKTKRRRLDRQHHWKFGHDPQDPDAEKGSGWEYVTVEVQPPPVPQPPKPYGTPSGLTCWQCHQAEYNIVDHKEIHEREWQYNKWVPIEDTNLALICPRCKHALQLLESTYKRLRAQVESRGKILLPDGRYV